MRLPDRPARFGVPTDRPRPTWIFTGRVDIAFDGGVLLPLAGLIFLPYTTLFCVFAYAPIVGVSGFGYFFVGLGVLLDLGTWFGGGREGRRATR